MAAILSLSKSVGDRLLAELRTEINYIRNSVDYGLMRTLVQEEVPDPPLEGAHLPRHIEEAMCCMERISRQGADEVPSLYDLDMLAMLPEALGTSARASGARRSLEQNLLKLVEPAREERAFQLLERAVAEFWTPKRKSQIEAAYNNASGREARFRESRTRLMDTLDDMAKGGRAGILRRLGSPFYVEQMVQECFNQLQNHFALRTDGDVSLSSHRDNLRIAQHEFMDVFTSIRDVRRCREYLAQRSR